MAKGEAGVLAEVLDKRDVSAEAHATLFGCFLCICNPRVPELLLWLGAGVWAPW